MGVRRRLVRLAASEPFLQASHLMERPAEIADQARDQRPGILTRDQSDQQAAGQQQKQLTHQRALPVLVHR